MLLNIKSFVLVCLDPSKPPSSGEAMISLCNYCMENSSKSFGTIRFTPDSAYMISKVSQAIGDSHTFEFFIDHSSNLCLNDLVTFSLNNK